MKTLKREMQVAFSRKAQPLWFRLVKWAVIVGASAFLWRTPYFGWWLLGALSFGLTIHFFWRWKTQGWTQPWGGWNDL